MDSKPVITYSGEQATFKSLEDIVVEGLPKASEEWKRSYGRPSKFVCVESKFVPFKSDAIVASTLKDLIIQPSLHTYWTSCYDVEVYKATVREDIGTWFTILKSQNVRDWMIIVVENADAKKANKLLPKTTVLDKIRNDFGQKQSDRCISVFGPPKSEASRSFEHIETLLIKLRQYTLMGFNRCISAYEDGMRAQREKRTDPKWCFCDYFLLQEELSFIFETLGLHDEALVQYDELDALFTQFVLNTKAGENPSWLNTFRKTTYNWSGINLVLKPDLQPREKIENKTISLLEFRSYLFSRQCNLLLSMCKPWEVARKTLSYLHNVINELRILDIVLPPGAEACWVFLSCLEVLRVCDRYNDTSQVDTYSLNTAGLWAYSKEKLHILGSLCGLTPGMTCDSTHLQLLVELIAGMGDDTDEDGEMMAPRTRLKEALSSQKMFIKHYLELSELAMGTYKHVGRIRSARLIGHNLAKFYMELGEYQKATSFLAESLNIYLAEGWTLLSSKTQLELLNCYQKLEDYDKLARTCAVVASLPSLTLDSRLEHLKLLIDTLKKNSIEKLVTISAQGILHVASMEISCGCDKIISGSEVTCLVIVESMFPAPVLIDSVKIALNLVTQPLPVVTRHSAHRKTEDGPASLTSNSSIESSNSGNLDCHSEFKLQISENLEYKQDKSLSSSGVVCKNLHTLLMRKESHPNIMKDKVNHVEFDLYFEAQNVNLLPGVNQLKAVTKAKGEGLYELGPISISVMSMEFYHEALNTPPNFRVISEVPKISLNKPDGDLLSGIIQEMYLQIESGSLAMPEDTFVKLVASRGLSFMHANEGEGDLGEKEKVVFVSDIKPFQKLTIPVNIMADLHMQKNTNCVEHNITIHRPWTTEELNVALHFTFPFILTHKLHTANTRKFIQVLVQGLSISDFCLSAHDLVCMSSDTIRLLTLNPPDQELLVCKDTSACYMWELVADSNCSQSLKLEFSLNYCLVGQPSKIFKYPFSIHDYKTLFTVRAKVDPSKGSEFCRAGAMCHMQIQILSVNKSAFHSLMYEVLCEQTMWAVCSKTSGFVVVDDSTGKYNVTLDIMPLSCGFLPLPTVRLSKCIPSEPRDQVVKSDISYSATSVSLLEPFSPGQVYNWSKAQQVHVLPATTTSTSEMS